MTDEQMSEDHVAVDAVTFDNFGFHKSILKSLKKQGFITPTPIQNMAILPVMSGTDLMGIAQTGSGKTAAFSLPTINKLIPDYEKPEKHRPKALILAPTRELVMQIGKFINEFSRGTPITSLVIAGGQSYKPQISKLKSGVDILIATPGRLIDHMQQKTVRLDRCETFILDEADRMLDMGFIEEVKSIQESLNEDHQTVMFTATMNAKVRKLSLELLKDPEYVEQERKTMVADTITHKLMNVRRKDKTQLLIDLLSDESIDKALVFARTKLGADRLCDELKEAFRETPLRIDAIHGDKKQRTREKILMNYRKGRTRVLVATDVAARGIDVDGITHVINYELPIEAENYVHRVGRTGRAGESGLAISFCDPSDLRLLKGIEELLKIKVDVDDNHEFHFEASDVRSNKKGRGKGRGRADRPRAKFDKSRGRAKKKDDRNDDFENKPSRPRKTTGKIRTEMPARADRPKSDKPKRDQKSDSKRYNPSKFDPLDSMFGFDDDPVLKKLQGKSSTRKKKAATKSGDAEVSKKKKTTKRDHFDDAAKAKPKRKPGKAVAKKNKTKPSRADRKKVKQTGGHKAFKPKRR
ncbi:DEAD/DEAH box helicase [Pseudemcibacter aquimaris]|uniref:DEAD/DEAH box helicase n=1 Tax=Pseudemcibacter aquimaris TaxID=2857064 RepID=UPI002010DA7D|nr:DEAD/DEAH box helicase [Pseudemcibacter aquimaris]MCC3859841.1 DEAD/DEAH box helicase [Pseudemcibacter aquimaris]WDU57173.1 DEAD/DEAH box helicase [Pseudemcibacter aquimaris]